MPAEAQSTLDVLVKARALIEKPENWCQGRYCDGARFCALGALYTVERPDYPSSPAYIALQSQMQGSVQDFNDTHTHAEVLAALDKAIAAERTKLEAERAS